MTYIVKIFLMAVWRVNHRRKERIKWVAWTSMVALKMERNRPIQSILWIESEGHAESLGGRE